MNIDLFVLGTELKRALWKSGLSYGQISEKAGLSNASVRSIGEGCFSGNARIKTFFKVCDAIGADPAEIIRKAAKND